MTHYCPVCYKKIHQETYGKSLYQGCIQMSNLTEDGWVSTAQGTIKLGGEPGEFEGAFPKEVFTEVYDAIREKQNSGSVRIGRCK